MNGLDNNIYSIGRGPSATTVTAPNTGLSLGSSVVIRGSVIDTSAGTKQSTQAADFPNGVPVASDASMKDWMGYVYQQKALPTNFTGVPVTISVLDSNGNYRNIGTATTDATGMYTVSWKPDITGNFTVVATFNALTVTGHHTQKQVLQLIQLLQQPLRILLLVCHQLKCTSLEQESQ